MKPSALRSSLLIAGALVAASDLAVSQMTLNANSGPSNNGLSGNAAIFFDLTATSAGVTITELTTATNAPASAGFTFEVLVFNGSGLGGPVSSGPGSSLTGWTSLGTASGIQGATANGVSLPIDIPDIVLVPNQVTGVALRWLSGGGPRYFGTGSGPYSVYSDANLTLTTGDARSAPFTATGSYFTPRAMVGSLTYTAGNGSVPYCFGDGSGAACPCGNASLPADEVGCLSSLGLGGMLRAVGNTSLSADSVALIGTQMPNSSALYFQGTNQLSGGLGSVFGDGLRCAGGTTTRLGTKTNVGGASQYPVGPDLPVSQRGLVLVPGTRTYQVWYRNAAAFCTVSTFNLSNGVEVTWTM